jgi:hypothetical protein
MWRNYRPPPIGDAIACQDVMVGHPGTRPVERRVGGSAVHGRCGLNERDHGRQLDRPEVVQVASDAHEFHLGAPPAERIEERRIHQFEADPPGPEA